MGWFAPKLEPGERIVLCLPRPARVNWLGAVAVALAFAPLIGMTAAYLTGLGDLGSREHRITTEFYIGVGILLLGISAIPATNFRWRVVVTARLLEALGRPAWDDPARDRRGDPSDPQAAAGGGRGAAGMMR